MFRIVCTGRKNSCKFTTDDIATEAGGGLARNDQNIDATRKLSAVAAKVLSNPPLDAVANHRIAHFGAHRDP